MKHIYLSLIAGLLLFTSPQIVQAQSDSLRVKALSDSVANLYERYFLLEKESKEAKEAVEKVKDLGNLENKFKVLENQAQANSEVLSKIDKEAFLDKKTKYENSKNTILAVSDYMNEVNNALNTMEVSFTALDYANSIMELNNPTNSDLGFSLDKVVVKLVEDKIINTSGKFGRKFGDRLKSIVSGIINNPIINNPITKGIVNTISTVPAVSSITSVFNVVNSLAVNNDEIGVNVLRNFSGDLQKYVQHYEALAQASQSLTSGINDLKVKSESVRKIATNFAKQSVSELYQADMPDISEQNLNDVIKKHYNYREANRYIASLEQKYQQDYGKLSDRVVFSSVGRNKVAFLGEEVERLYNEYLSTLKNYHERVLNILKNAQENKLSEKQDAILNKRLSLETQYENLVKTYERSVGIENLRRLSERIPRF